jgi:PAS domain S-box-containing protein
VVAAAFGGRDEGQEPVPRLLDELQVGVLVQGRRSQVLYANRVACELLGVSHDQLLGLTCFEPPLQAVREDGTPLPGEDHPCPRALATRRAVRNVVLGVDRAAARDRVWLLVSAQPELDASGNVRQVVSTLTDVTPRRHAEDRLRESETRYRQLVEKAQDIIYRTNPKGYFIYVNPMTCRATGYGEVELVGRPFTDFVRPDHRGRVMAALADQLDKRVPTTYDEFAILTKGGDEVWIGQNVQLLEGDERVQGLQAVARDITDRKRAQEAVEAARSADREASRAKAEFLAGMGDELRRPLDAILGVAELLLGSALDEAQQEWTHTIEGSAATLRGRLDRILEFAALEGGRATVARVELDAGRVVREAASRFVEAAARKGLALDVDAPDPFLAVEGDSERLRRILECLIDNAVKFTDTGRVRVSAAIAGGGRDSVQVRFEVQDSGRGIGPQVHKRLFRPFVPQDDSPRRHAGAGLGLAIARGWVDAMNGSMGFTTQPGQGSTFWFTVPFPRAGSHSAAGAAAAAEPPARVLVVEDSHVNRKLLVAILEHLGYRVDALGNGVDAVEAAARTRFDAILMDCQLPQMDGFAATAWIRQREEGRRTPIIALTASVLPGDREKCFAAGMDDYLGKPYGIRELTVMLEKWVRRSEPEIAPAPAKGVSSFGPDHPLRVLESQGRSRLAAEIIDLFLETAPQRIAGLKQGVGTGDVSALATLAQGLKGATVRLGARRMSELCAQIQAAARSADARAAGQLVSDLESEFETLRRSLKEERKRLALGL